MSVKTNKITSSKHEILFENTTLNIPQDHHAGQIIQTKTYFSERPSPNETSFVQGTNYNWAVYGVTTPRDFVLSSVDNYVFVTAEFNLADTTQLYTFDFTYTLLRGWHPSNPTWPGLTVPTISTDSSLGTTSGSVARPVFAGGATWENVWIKDLDTIPSHTNGAYDGMRFLHTSGSNGLIWNDLLTIDYFDTNLPHLSNFQYAFAIRMNAGFSHNNRAYDMAEGCRITLTEISKPVTNFPPRRTSVQTTDRTKLNKIIGGLANTTGSIAVTDWNSAYTPSNYFRVNLPHSSTPNNGDKALAISLTNSSSGFTRTIKIYKEGILIHTFTMATGVANAYFQDGNNINFSTLYQYRFETITEEFDNQSSDLNLNITTPAFGALAENTLSTTTHTLNYTDSSKGQSMVIEFNDVGSWYDVSRYIWKLYNPGPAGIINIGRPGTSLLTAQSNGQYFYLNRPEGAGSQTHTDLEISYNSVPNPGSYAGRIKIEYDASASSTGRYRLFIDEVADGTDQTTAQAGVYAAYGDPTAILTGISKPYYGNGTPHQYDSANGYLRHAISFSTDTTNNGQYGLETKDSNGNVVSQIFSIQPDLAHSDGPSGNNPATITTGYWGDGTVFPTTETMTGSFSWTTPIAGVHTVSNGLPTVSWNVNLPSTSGIHFHVSIYNPNDTVNSTIVSNSNFSLTALEVDIANSWEPFATDSIAAKDPVNTTFSLTELMSRGTELGHIKPGDTVRIKAKFFYIAEGHNLPKLNSAYNGQVYNIWQLGKHSEPEWSKTVDITIPAFVTVTDKKYYHTLSWSKMADSLSEYRIYYNDVSNVVYEQGGSRLAGVYGEAGTSKYKVAPIKQNSNTYTYHVSNVSHSHGKHIGQKIAGTGFYSGAPNTQTGATKALDEILNQTRDILVDSNGVIYLLVRHEIKKITLQSDGTYNTETWVGSQSSGYQNGTGTAARFTSIMRGCIDSNNNIFLTEQNNLAIRKVTPAGVVTTIAGGPPVGVGDGNPFGDYPNNYALRGITVDSNGDLFITANHVIKKVTQAGVITNVSGGGPSTGAPYYGSTEGVGYGDSNAPYYRLAQDITIGSDDTLYIADKYSHVYKLTNPGFVATKLSGTIDLVYGTGNAVGTLAQSKWNNIETISCDTTTDLLYVGDQNGGVMKIVDEANDLVKYLSDDFLNVGGQSKLRRLPNNAGFISISEFGTTIYKYTPQSEDYFINAGDAKGTDKTKVYTYWDGNNVPKSSGDSTVTVRKFFGIGAVTSGGLCPLQIEEIPVVLNPNLNNSSTYTIDTLSNVSMNQYFQGNYSYFQLNWDPDTAIGLSYVVIERTSPTTATFRVPPHLGTYNDFPSVQGGNPGGSVTEGDTYTYEIYGERWCDPTGQSSQTWDSMRTQKSHAAVVTRSVTAVSGKPTADFTFVIAQSGSNWQVTFTNSSYVNNPSATITGYSWDFGDGNTSTDTNPVHTFTSGNAFYNVDLTVTQDVYNLSETVTKMVPLNVDIEVLLIGGGGSGARGSYNPVGNGAGGGAGAAYFLSGSNKISVPAYTDLSFVVGAGGAIPGFQARGNNGGTTSMIKSSTPSFQYDAGGGGGGGGGSGGGNTSGKNNTDGVDAPTQSGSPTGFFRGNGGGGGLYFFYQGLGGAGTHQGYTSSGSSGHGAGVNGQGSTYTDIGPGQNIGTGASDHDKTFRSATTETIGQGGRGQPPTSSSPITSPIPGAGSGGYGGQSNPNFYGQGNVPDSGNDGGVYIKVPSTFMITNNAGWQMDQGNYTHNGITYDFYYVTTSGYHTIKVIGPFGN